MGYNDMTQNVQELLCQELFVQNALQVRNSAVKSREEEKSRERRSHGEAMLPRHVATPCCHSCATVLKILKSKSAMAMLRDVT